MSQLPGTEVEFGFGGDVKVDGVTQRAAPVVGNKYRVVKKGDQIEHFFDVGDLVKCSDVFEGKHFSGFRRVRDRKHQIVDNNCVEEIAQDAVLVRASRQPQQRSSHPPAPLNAALLVALVRVVAAYDVFAGCQDDSDAAYEALGKAVGKARQVIERAETEER